MNSIAGMPRTASKNRQSNRIINILWLLPAAFLLIFFIFPLVTILVKMAAWEGVISLTGILRPVWFSVWQALLSTLLTLLLGLPAAFVFARFDFQGKRLLRLLSNLPFILPTVVVAAGFAALLGPRGLLNLWLMQWFQLQEPPIVFMNTLGAILIAHVFYNTSVVIRVVGSALSQLDPRLEEAGKVLGAKPGRVLREITMPVLLPSIAVAALMVFLFDFTSFGVVLLLGGPKFSNLEVAIYTQTLSMFNLRMAGILTFLQLVFTLGITLVNSKVGNQFIVPLAPRVKNEGLRKAVTFLERAGILCVLILLVVLLVSPLAALTARSLLILEPGSDAGMTFSFLYYRELFINRANAFFYVPPVNAALNSFFYAFVTTVISVVLGLITAYSMVRKATLQKWLDPLIMLPLGTSAVTLGLGFLITFSGSPLDVKHFPLLIPIAHSLVALPFVVRTIQPVLASIPSSLGESAACLGASPWRVWKEVKLPIIRRAALVGAIFSFTISLGEFGATSFLARPETPTLPVAIYRFLSQPGAINYGQAMAMSTILMLVCAAAIAGLDRLQPDGNSRL